jgi:hypothetical protein
VFAFFFFSDRKITEEGKQMLKAKKFAMFHKNYPLLQIDRLDLLDLTPLISYFTPARYTCYLPAEITIWRYTLIWSGPGEQ